MQNFRVIYKRPDFEKNQSVIVKAYSKEDIEKKFKLSLFKDCQIIAIEEAL